MTALRSVLAVLSLCALLAGCASTGGSGASSGEAVRITFHDLRTDQELAVVNDGMLRSLGVEGASPEERRAEFYSAERVGTKPKVASDALMSKIVDFLDYHDFDAYAIEGNAPRGGNVSQTIELLVDGRARHLVAFRGMDSARAKAFVDTVQGFVLTYNEIPQLQTVEGDFQFEGVQIPATRRRQ